MVPITVDPKTTTKPELLPKLEELTSYVKDNIPDITAQQSKITLTSHLSQITSSISLTSQHRNGESLTMNPTMSNHHSTHNYPQADEATNSDPYYTHTDNSDNNNYYTTIPP
ncbi:21293_t:CDS:2, partial [Gigaspora margarita]